MPSRRKKKPPGLSPWVLGALAGASVLALGGVALAARGGRKPCTLTCYFPHATKNVAREGGRLDRRDRPAYTLQEYLRGEAPYVAISGDPDLFPYGTRIQIAYLDEQAGRPVEARVVDVGDHFHGPHKVYRFAGSEPLDVACDNDEGFGIVRSTYRVLGPAGRPAPKVA